MAANNQSSTVSLVPPRMARWIVSRCSPARDRLELLGDLREGFAGLARTAGRRAASRWYWLQTMSVVLRFIDPRRIDRPSPSRPPPNGSTHMIRGFINALGTDLAYAVRNYSRSPLFTATIRRQRREIGIRMALGAPTGRIFRDVMRRGLRLAVIGVGLGIVGAVGVVRAMKGLVFGVDVLDGTTFAAVSAIGLIVATTASLSPALRASRVDPLKILQSE